MARGVSPRDIPKQGNQCSVRLPIKKRRLAAEDLVGVQCTLTDWARFGLDQAYGGGDTVSSR